MKRGAQTRSVLGSSGAGVRVVAGVLLLCSYACGSKSADGPEQTEGQRLFLMEDLGPGRCIAMNKSGDVVGIGEDDDPFIVNLESRERRPLGHFRDGDVTVPAGISDSGDVAGYTESIDGRHAVRFAAGAWSLVAETPEEGVATSINREGALTGYINTPAGLHGFVSQNGSLESLALPMDMNSIVYAVNALGHAIGIVETSAGETHAFVHRDGTLVDLGTLGGKNSTALGINAAGDVAGSAEDDSGEAHAFVTLFPGTTMTTLALPEGAVASDARGIDDKKRIYGNARYASGAGRPFWFRDGDTPVDITPHDAEDVAYYSAQIATVTPEGHVVGWGVPRGAVGGVAHCTVWTPRKN